MKNGSENIYLHPKPFNNTVNLSWYLMSLSRRDPVNPSTSSFRNINLTKIVRNLPVVSNVLGCKNECDNLYLYNNLFKITLNLNSYLTSIFCCGLLNPSTLEIYILFQMLLKKTAIISICFLRSFIEAQSQIHIWCRFPVVPL